MAQRDNICIELAFNEKIRYSQRVKVQNFWKFLDDANLFKPYTVTSAKKLSKIEEPKSPRCKRMWYNQLKVFQEHGLDNVALATGKECKLCSDQINYKCQKFSDVLEDPYDELLNDMKAFDERSADKANTELIRKTCTNLCVPTSKLRHRIKFLSTNN
ncbi:hypothetical protein WH47_09707 [Habropoda laboriosa]|uniref:Uncharacterized protein n=1 Tax=Habropoda laboriosa TaxID=597456 RepID=A0A0L7QMG6_9HYME|nr:hypothetical protein WH47_09707 [Habropoda laboriosa]